MMPPCGPAQRKGRDAAGSDQRITEIIEYVFSELNRILMAIGVCLSAGQPHIRRQGERGSGTAGGPSADERGGGHLVSSLVVVAGAARPLVAMTRAAPSAPAGRLDLLTTINVRSAVNRVCCRADTACVIWPTLRQAGRDGAGAAP
jgi:hypothetical protein